MAPITIWVVEDDAGYRRTLKDLLNAGEATSCRRVFPSCDELFKALGSEEHPDLLMMDLGLPGMAGVEGIRKLAAEAPDIAVLVITVFREKEKVIDALSAGASGYLLKTATGREILEGIEQVFKGGAALSPEVAKIVLTEVRKPSSRETFGLSGREIEVLEQLAQDQSVKEIADHLGISRRTAAFHLENIYRKLQVQSQSGAVAKALRSGII
ncbi:response regulator [Haloferula chungangensis]|uniref:Response regulator n=1 Tax=Haloferula chungangensis TaxID=1048331 RepID=A0ABW2LCY1_9BACT